MCEYFNHFHRVATRYDKTSAHLLVVRPAYGQLRMAQNGNRTYSPREILRDQKRESSEAAQWLARLFAMSHLRAGELLVWLRQ